MNSEASAQQQDATAGDPPPPGATGRRAGPASSRRGFGRALWLAFLGAWAGLGAWHLTKPLPPGTRIASPWEEIPADSLRLLVDGKLIWGGTIGADAVAWRAGVMLPPGATTVVFATDRPPVRIGTDPRDLAFQVANLEIVVQPAAVPR